MQYLSKTMHYSNVAFVASFQFESCGGVCGSLFLVGGYCACRDCGCGGVVGVCSDLRQVYAGLTCYM